MSDNYSERGDDTSRSGRRTILVPSMADTEHALIGFCLFADTTERWRHVTDICGLDSAVDLFYHSAFRTVADAMAALLEQDESVTIHAVGDRLANRGVQTLGVDSLPVDEFLLGVSMDIALSTTEEADRAVGKLKEVHQRRNIITALEEAIEMAVDTDTSLSKLSGTLSMASTDALAAGTRRLQDFGDIHDEVMFTETSTFSVPSGLPTIDEAFGGGGSLDEEDSIGGFGSGRTYVVAAGPGVGKTTTMFRFAREAVTQGAIPIIFSLESSKADILSKLVSGDSNAPFKQVMKSYESQNPDFAYVEEQRRDDVLASVEKFREKMVKIVGKDDLVNGIHDIPSAVMGVRDEIGDPGAKIIVFIDYLQLLITDSNYERQQLSNLTRNLHNIAQSLDVPIVELSQFSRIEKGVRPRLSDLYGSSSIEKDSDGVMLMWRPGEQENPEDADGDEFADINNPNVMMVHLAKNRVGEEPLIEAWMDHSRCIVEEPTEQQWDELLSNSPQTTPESESPRSANRSHPTDESRPRGTDGTGGGSARTKSRRNATSAPPHGAAHPSSDSPRKTRRTRRTEGHSADEQGGNRDSSRRRKSSRNNSRSGDDALEGIG